MSSRVLRKLGLQRDKELTPPACLQDDPSDTEADFSNSGGAKKKQLNVNRYDLLNQQSHSESEVKEDDDHETASSLNAHDGICGGGGGGRKKKKKKRKSGKFVTHARSSEDNIEDEVERCVREVNALVGAASDDAAAGAASAAALPPGGASTRRGLLSIEHRTLNPNNELRRIFGTKIFQNEQVKKRGRSRSHLKSTWLVTPKDNWPQVGKPGLSMKLLETKNGIHYFAYEHSVNYQQVQLRFLDAVESLNPDNIVAIINTHPYHVDALLQLSELCRLSEDLPMAAELVERALYCLECAQHVAFSIATGQCRLDYRRQENRALYIALFKHMIYVGSRACYRTALEFCKLLLSLDPESDPLAAILAIDFYALRSQEYEWLIRLAEEWESSRNLSQLPNFAYSLAVAHFQLNNVETANTLLQKALVMFPGVLPLLLSKCGTQTDARVSSSTFFSCASETQSKSLTQLEIMYVARCYHVWKESELLPWLERNVHAALDMVDAGDPSVAEYLQYRTKRYPAAPRNIHRHIILSDIKEVPSIFEQDMQSPVLSFDPLPPHDSINVYMRTVRIRTYENDNALSVFFRSFMPNFVFNQVASDEAGEEAGGEGSSGGVDLRRSVASLLDAMRDLLSNIHMPDVPGDGDAEDDPDSDEAAW
ncbi:hypothetical protein AAG570_004691 [Ranatra chinensis]|uniref:Transcription factor 25 n=1 Tax=Ranatra chinensis TaxID=642074 RepID=A0ABD0YQ44_9HEMI